MNQPKSSSKNVNRILVNNTSKKARKSLNEALYGVK